jgi:hypothetical protein
MINKEREIHCYDYINHPYPRVRDTLTADAPTLFQSATNAAVSRAQSVASQLRVDFGGIAVEADIRIWVKQVDEKPSGPMSSPVTRVQFEWQAAKMPSLFPLMRAELAVYPLTATETQLDFSGLYEPPLGGFGKTVDSIVGHRIAEVSVHRFVSDVAEYLRRALTNK